MAEEYLQVAFEIKSECDSISQRILQWHWENKTGAHTFRSFMTHLSKRKKESPVYYERLPEMEGKKEWGQLDTTLCMRVLLDPEKDAAKPLDLLGNTPRPGAARRACNAIRTARNEAAHASDRKESQTAAQRFREAIEALTEGYQGTAFQTKELTAYTKKAEKYLSRCGVTAKTETKQSRTQDVTREPSVSSKSASRKKDEEKVTTTQKEQKTSSAKQGTKSQTTTQKKSAEKLGTAKSSTAKADTAKKTQTDKKQETKKEPASAERLLKIFFWGIAIFFLLIGFMARTGQG